MLQSEVPHAFRSWELELAGARCIFLETLTGKRLGTAPDTAVTEMGAREVLALIQRDPTHLAYPTLLTGKNLGVDEVRRVSTLGLQTCMIKPYGGSDGLERVAKLLKTSKSTMTPAGPIPQRPRTFGSAEVLL